MCRTLVVIKIKDSIPVQLFHSELSAMKIASQPYYFTQACNAGDRLSISRQADR